MRTQLHHLLAEAADRSGDAPAITVKDTTRSYAQIWTDTVAVGSGLRRPGLSVEDRVAVYLDKRVETVTAIFGTSVAGGVFVPVNPLLRSHQVAFILADCDARVLITTPERLAMLGAELTRCTALEHVVVVGNAQTNDEGALYQVSSWDDLTTGPAHQPADGIDVSMAAILYTSGSTGPPKGVVVSHRNLIVGAESVSSYLANTSDDVIAAVLPLSFDAGFSQLTTAFSVGAHVILINYLAPADVLNQCTAHGVTGLTCVPPLWIQLADLDWPSGTAARLRYFANTGGRMPKPTLDLLRSRFSNAAPYLMYGLTEAFRSTYLDPSEVDRRPDSIGKAIPNAEVLVVREDGSICDANEPGELVHRGALVSLGYWNDPERTAERFRPAPGRPAGLAGAELAVWSGDLVSRDEDGFLYFISRDDAMIKTSGYRVSPTEIEEAAHETGMVRFVVAVGVNDDRLGQHIVVVASPHQGETLDGDALVAALRKRLPRYMVPRRVIVRSEIPRSPNGKLDRNLIQAEVAGL